MSVSDVDVRRHVPDAWSGHATKSGICDVQQSAQLNVAVSM
jgi:hypothetical protein